MHLKLDENFGRQAADFLAAAGLEVETVLAEGLCRASDREVARRCRDEARCLVTLDLDFGNPLLFTPSEYSGIAVIRLRGRAEPEEIRRALGVLVEALRVGSIVGKLWIVEPNRLREYQPEN